jgi:hypothetical protein
MHRKSLPFVLVAFVLCYTLPTQQNEFVKPSLSDKDSWSMILLPDLQTYVKFDYNQPTLDLMMDR